MNENIERINTREEVFKKDEFLRFRILSNIVKTSDYEALEHYMSKGFELNPRSYSLKTPAFMFTDSTVEFAKLAIEKGMDPFVMDIEGNTVLHEVVKSENKQMMVYLLELGLNPYQPNFVKEDSFYTMVFNFKFNSNLLKEFTIHNGYTTASEALADRNYPLALQIAQDDLKALGGFTALFKNIHKSNVHNFMHLIYKAFVVNGMYKEANSLMNAFIDASNKISDNRLLAHNKYIFSPEAAMVQGDVDSVVKVLEANIEHASQSQKDAACIYALLTMKVMDIEDVELIKKANDTLKEFPNVKENFLYRFINDSSNSTEAECFAQIKELEKQAFNEDKPLEFRFHFYLLTAYIHLNRHDLVNAQYMLNEIVKIVNETKRFDFKEHEKAVALIDYINFKLV